MRKKEKKKEKKGYTYSLYSQTTLLNYILKQNHGKKIAVIENEFGEVSILLYCIVLSCEIGE